MPVRSVRPHEKLDAWKISMDLAHAVYEKTKSFPKEEIYGITAQVRRAAASAPANIAEGCARQTDAERRQFLYIARGSLSELETFLALSTRLAYLSAESSDNLMTTCGRVGALLNGMINR